MTELQKSTIIGRYLKAVSAIVSFVVLGYLCNQYDWLLKHSVSMSVTVIAVLTLVNAAVPVTFKRDYKESHELFVKLDTGSTFQQFCVWCWYSLALPMTGAAYFLIPADDLSTWYLKIGLIIYVLNSALGLITLVRFYVNKPSKG